MHEQIINLQQIFDDNRNPENAVHMEKYMRDQFPFIGLKSTERRKLARQFMKETKFDEQIIDNLIKSLWNLQERDVNMSL